VLQQKEIEKLEFYIRMLWYFRFQFRTGKTEYSEPNGDRCCTYLFCRCILRGIVLSLSCTKIWNFMLQFRKIWPLY